VPRKFHLDKSRQYRLTPAAIEAFKAGDYHRLHQALGLGPWEPSPLPVEIIGALGVRPGDPPNWPGADNDLWVTRGWPKAQALQRELLAVLGLTYAEFIEQKKSTDRS
jgi:hypothetical protein